MQCNIRMQQLVPLILYGVCTAPMAQERAFLERIERIEQGLTPAQVLAGSAVVGQALTDEMRRLRVPGVSIAVIDRGQIAWAKGYGVTHAGGPAVTPQTRFQAASISKPVAAMGAMQMAQSGLLDLDAPVNRYLKSWQLSGVDGSAKVTLRQLLSHTAGVNVSGFPGYHAGAPVPTLRQVLDGKGVAASPALTEAVRVTSTPGSAWRYSGGGYSVIEQAMTEVGAMTFASLMKRHVLQPIGMRDSSFTQAPPSLTHRVAPPHDALGLAIPGGPARYPELAAAGMWTTPTDLAKFVLSLQRSATGQNGRVLQRQAALTMLTPVKNGYGLGVETGGSAPNHSFAHGGSNQGYQNALFAYVERGQGAVVMTNGDGGAELAQALIRAVAAAYAWPSHQVAERVAVPLAADMARRAAGRYAIKGLGDFEITKQDGALTFWIKKGQGERLYAESPTKFFVLSQTLELHWDGPGSDGGRLTAGSFDVRFDAVR